MRLIIVTPQEQKIVEVVWIEINTPSGNFIIQNGHAQTTFALLPAKELVYCFKTGKQESLTLEKGGILEVEREKVTALIGT